MTEHGHNHQVYLVKRTCSINLATKWNSNFHYNSEKFELIYTTIFELRSSVRTREPILIIGLRDFDSVSANSSHKCQSLDGK